MRGRGGRCLLLGAALTVLAACGASEAVKEAQRTKAAMHLKNVKMAVSIYLVEQGKLPESLSDLEKPFVGTLDKYPEGIMPGAAKDPWGNSVIYEPSPPRKFLLRSLGADGKPGGEGADADMDSDHLDS